MTEGDNIYAKQSGRRNKKLDWGQILKVQKNHVKKLKF
jgi:hypothetical protein